MSKPVKAILVDPRDQTIKEVILDAEDGSALQDILEHVGSEYLDCARIDKRDGFFVDDEGLINGLGEREGGFVYHDPQNRITHTLAGRGLLVGCDEEGATDDVRHTTTEIQRCVSWLTPQLFFAGLNAF